MSSSPTQINPDTWIPPRTPRSAHMRNLPFRRSHRAPVYTNGSMIEPGHPGRACIEILDVCADGLFLADDEHALEREASVRIGLPLSIDSSQQPLWAWAKVRWRGEKHGRRGVGVKLSFDDECARRAWRRSVADFMQARLNTAAPTGADTR